MITEDYVSFETAKLLKEKGFNPLESRMYYSITTGKKTTELLTSLIACPTLQMTMKWLREAHNICITMYPVKGKGYEAVPYDIKDDAEIILQSFGIYGGRIFRDSYEQACEAAIKYCLENLI